MCVVKPLKYKGMLKIIFGLYTRFQQIIGSSIPVYFTASIYIYRTRTQAHSNGFCSSIGGALV